MSEADIALPIPYTASEVGRTFAAVLESFTFAAEMHDIGIGTLSVFKRRNAKKRFTALCITLWRIALEKSFPKDADVFFDHFIATYPPLCGENKSASQMRDLVALYDGLAAEKKDGDFTKLAENMADFFNFPDKDRPRQQLKLSLRIRSLYELIFEKLI